MPELAIEARAGAEGSGFHPFARGFAGVGDLKRLGGGTDKGACAGVRAVHRGGPSLGPVRRPAEIGRKGRRTVQRGAGKKIDRYVLATHGPAAHVGRSLTIRPMYVGRRTIDDIWCNAVQLLPSPTGTGRAPHPKSRPSQSPNCMAPETQWKKGPSRARATLRREDRIMTTEQERGSTDEWTTA